MIRNSNPHFSIIVHGIDSASYFPGCGTSHTPYTHVSTGIGENAKDAYLDAVDQMYTRHKSKAVEALRLPRNPRGIRQSDSVKHVLAGTSWDACEEWPQYYVSILYTIVD